MAPKLPYFPFWCKDWETDSKVRQMGPAARGYYITLLVHQWIEGSIPRDMEQIERLVAMPRDPVVWDAINSQRGTTEDYPEGDLYDQIDRRSTIRATLAQVLQCFPVDRDVRRNKRLDLLRRETYAKHDAFVASGKLSRISHITKGASRVPPGTLQQTDTDTYTEEEKNKRRPKPPAVVFVLPDWVPQKAWDDYIEMRNRIRKPMTDRAKQLAVGELEKLRQLGHKPESVLERSVLNSWQGLFEPKFDPHSTSRPTKPHERHPDEIIAEMRKGHDKAKGATGPSSQS